ncbi:hypothetical protein BASA61_004653 [Batrachochytrium salamandrivorans]|nr:hypothetical protein BASA61_004653 [Batrachochytrium salamandrivorans]
MDLCTLAFRGDVQQAQNLLQAGDNPNTNSLLWNALLACVVDSDPSVLDSNTHTKSDSDVYHALPLHCAVMQGHYDMVQLLLDHGASITKKDSRERTALICCIYGSCDTLTITPMNQASVTKVTSNNIAIGRLLLRTLKKDTLEEPELFNECVNEPQSGPLLRGVTPLCLAAYLGKTEMIRILIQNGAFPDAKDLNGSTPLMYAAREGHTKAVEVLLFFQALPTIQDNYGWTSVQYAEPFAVIVKLLNAKISTLEAAAAAAAGSKKKTAKSLTPLAPVLGTREPYQAVTDGTPTPTVSSSLRHTPLTLPPCVSDPYGTTLPALAVGLTPTEQYVLFSSIKNGELGGVESVLQGRHGHAAALYVDPQSGLTALQYAVRHRPLRSPESLSIVQLLIQSGAVANAANTKTGKTALHYILRDPYPEKVESATVKIESNALKNETVTGLIQEEYNPLKKTVCDIIRFLLESKASANGADGSGHHPLHYASRTGEIEFVKILLENGADVTAINRKGKRADQDCESVSIIKMLQNVLSNPIQSNAKKPNGSVTVFKSISEDVFSAEQSHLHVANEAMSQKTVDTADINPSYSKRATNIGSSVEDVNTVESGDNPNLTDAITNPHILSKRPMTNTPHQLHQSSVNSLPEECTSRNPNSDPNSDPDPESALVPESQLQCQSELGSSTLTITEKTAQSPPFIASVPDQAHMNNDDIQKSDHILMKQIYHTLCASRDSAMDLPTTDTMGLFKQLLSDSDRRCTLLEHELDQVTADEAVRSSAFQDHIKRIEQDVLIAEARMEKSSKEVARLSESLKDAEQRADMSKASLDSLMMAYQKSLDISHRLANTVDEQHDAIDQLEGMLAGDKPRHASGRGRGRDVYGSAQALLDMSLLCCAAQFDLDAIEKCMAASQTHLEEVRTERTALLSRAGLTQLEPMERDEDLLKLINEKEQRILERIEKYKSEHAAAQLVVNASIANYTAEQNLQADVFENLGSDVTANDKEDSIHVPQPCTWVNQYQNMSLLLDTFDFEWNQITTSRDESKPIQIARVYAKTTTTDGSDLRVAISPNTVARLLQVSQRTLRMHSQCIEELSGSSKSTLMKLEHSQSKLQDTTRHLLMAKNELKDLAGKFSRMDDEMVVIESKLDVVNQSRLEEIQNVRQLVSLLVGGSNTPWGGGVRNSPNGGFIEEKMLDDDCVSIQQHEGLVGSVKYLLASIDAGLLERAGRGEDVDMNLDEMPVLPILSGDVSATAAGQKDIDLHRYALQAYAVVHLSLCRLKSYCESLGVAMHALKDENAMLQSWQSAMLVYSPNTHLQSGDTMKLRNHIMHHRRSRSATSSPLVSLMEDPQTLPSMSEISTKYLRSNTRPVLSRLNIPGSSKPTSKKYDRDRLVVSMSPISPVIDSSMWSDYPVSSSTMKHESNDHDFEAASSRTPQNSRFESIVLPNSAKLPSARLEPHLDPLGALHENDIQMLLTPTPVLQHMPYTYSTKNSFSSDDSAALPITLVEKSIAKAKRLHMENSGLVDVEGDSLVPATELCVTGKVGEYLDALESLKADMLHDPMGKIHSGRDDMASGVGGGSGSGSGSAVNDAVAGAQIKKLAYKEMVRKLIAAMKAESGMSDTHLTVDTVSAQDTTVAAALSYSNDGSVAQRSLMAAGTVASVATGVGGAEHSPSIPTHPTVPYQMTVALNSDSMTIAPTADPEDADDETPIGKLVSRTSPGLDVGATRRRFHDRRLGQVLSSLQTRPIEVGLDRPLRIEGVASVPDDSFLSPDRSPASPLAQPYLEDIHVRSPYPRHGSGRAAFPSADDERFKKTDDMHSALVARLRKVNI